MNSTLRFTCLLGLLAIAPVLRAQDPYAVWSGAVDDYWFDPLNWEPGAPQVFPIDPASPQLVGPPDFQMGAVVYTGNPYISLGTTMRFLVVSGSATVQVLSFSSPAYVFSSSGTVGNAAGDDASLIASGGLEGVSWTFTNELTVGAAGAGRVTLNDGAAVIAPLIRLAPDPGSVGVLNIGAASGDAPSGAGTFTADTITGGMGTAQIVFNHDNTSLVATLSAALTGSVSVSHLSGTSVLSGDSTYTGGTIIDGGILAAAGYLGLDHSSLGAGPVTVNNGGTLAGLDYITGLTTVNAGGHLAPGNFLRFDGGLTLNSGAVLDFELGTAGDYMAVNGTLTGAAGIGGVTFYFSDAGDFAAGASYQLIDATGATLLSGFDVTDFTGTGIAGYTFAFDFSGSVLSVTASAIPEPSTCAAILGLGALGMVAWRRRR
jgi:autotransporter-associated beta strand protein